MVWCLSKSYAHNHNSKKTTCGKKDKEKEKRKKKAAQIGTNVSASVFNAVLLARSH
jgi:hypothetical protein